MIMAKDEKKGGFFSRFKKSDASSQEELGVKTATPQPSQAQSRTVAATQGGKSPLVSAALPKATVAPESAEDPALSEPLIDTVEAFNVYCSSLVDIGTSQLKMVEMVCGMLSNSLNKIIDGSAAKE